MATIRTKVRMQSTASHYFRTTSKNARTNPEKKSRKYYDPIVRKHVVFEEKKISK